MRRRSTILLLAIGVAAAFGPSCRREAPRPRNLLLISVDTLRADRLGAYGYPRGTSPAFDRFAETAVVFDDAQAQSSWTLASFASLFTSLYPSTHGCTGYNSRLTDAHTTLAERLTDAGFETAGVVSHVYLGRRFGLHQGFAEYDESLVLEIMESHEAISSDEVTARGAAWLRERDRRTDAAPWMLWLHYFDPHEVYQPHPGISERFGTELDSDLYDGEIAFTDRAIGRVLDVLAETGAADDTVVVFVSDHGEEFGDHGDHGHGHTLHRELVRVPLALRVPGLAPRRVTDVVRLVDVAPTVLELLGVSPFTHSEGEDLTGLMRGERGHDRPALSELRLQREFGQALRFGRWKLMVERRLPKRLDGEILEPGTKNQVHLYDVERDPTEQIDVAAEHPDAVRRLREWLDAMIKLAEARAAGGLFGEASTVDLSERELQQLRDLGYTK